MFDKTQISQFRQQLLELQKTLVEDNESGDLATQVVELDQSSVGRLSRMDAMQGQAMAQESERRRMKKLEQIKLALLNITNDDFGICLSCGEAIAIKRIEYDPTSTLCIDCANLSEGSL